MMQRLVILILMVFVLAGCSTTKSRFNQESSHQLAETQVRLGMGYMQKGDLDIALEKLKSALVTAKDYAPGHTAIAILYGRLGHFKKADDHYEKAIKLAPESGMGHNNYGAFLCDQKRYAKAYKHFILAAENTLYKTPQLAYENAGLCAMREENYDAAELAFRKALGLNSKLTASLLNMAKIAQHKKSYLQGRAYIQRFEEVASHTAVTLALAIEIERGLGSETRVASYSEMLRSRFPDSVQAGKLIE